jgi:hypothetical protein
MLGELGWEGEIERLVTPEKVVVDKKEMKGGGAGSSPLREVVMAECGHAAEKMEVMDGRCREIVVGVWVMSGY